MYKMVCGTSTHPHKVYKTAVKEFFIQENNNKKTTQNFDNLNCTNLLPRWTTIFTITQMKKRETGFTMSKDIHFALQEGKEVNFQVQNNNLGLHLKFHLQAYHRFHAKQHGTAEEVGKKTFCYIVLQAAQSSLLETTQPVTQ